MAYSILLWEPTLPKAEGLEDLLARVPGWTRLDAVRALQRCRGILCEGLTLETAQHIGEVLQSRGIRLFLMRTADMVPVPKPWPCRNADCLPGGLRIVELTGPARMLDWHAVIGVFVGRLRRRGRKREVQARPGRYMGSTAVPMATGSTEVVYRAVDELADTCDVVVDHPPERLRFERTGLNYDYLGDRLRQDTRANFAAFVGDLHRFAPHAVFNDGFRLYLSDPNDRGLLQDDERSFEDEMRWLINRAAVDAQD